MSKIKIYFKSIFIPVILGALVGGIISQSINYETLEMPFLAPQSWRLFAFFWILLLIGLVVKMIIEFYKKDNISGLLQIPYLVWLIFAAYLNLGVYLLN